MQMQAERDRKEGERRLARREADRIMELVQRENEQDMEATEQRRHLRRELVQKALEESSADQAKRQQDLKLKTEQEESSVEQYRKKLSDRDKGIQQERWEKAVQRDKAIKSAAPGNVADYRKREEQLEAKAAEERASIDRKKEAAEKA